MLPGAQSLQGKPVQDERGYAVVARPVFREPFHPRVEHPQAPAPGVVQVVEVGITAEDENNAGVGDSGAQVDRLVGDHRTFRNYFNL